MLLIFLKETTHHQRNYNTPQNADINIHYFHNNQFSLLLI